MTLANNSNINNNNNNNNSDILYDYRNNTALQKRRKHDKFGNLVIRAQNW